MDFVEEDGKEIGDKPRVITPAYWQVRASADATHHKTMNIFILSKDPSILTFKLLGFGHNNPTPVFTPRVPPPTAVKRIGNGRSGRGRRGGKMSRGAPRRRGPQLEVVKIWNEFSQSPPFMKRPFKQLNKPFYVCQSIASQNILTLSASVDTAGAAYFTVGALNQISNFTGMFDQYKIILIECTIGLSTTGTVATASAAAASQYCSYIDYDDATAPASYASAIENQNANTTTVIESHYHKFVPHIAVASYSGTFTSFTNEVAPWIDAASTGVQHYGLKVAAQAASTVNPIVFTAKLHMLWRQVR